MTSSVNLPAATPLTRRRFLVGTGSLAAMALIGCGGSDSSSTGSAANAKAAPAKLDGDLNLFTWEGYVPDPVVKAFEQEYGVKVKQTFFSTEEEMLKKLTAGLPYDMTFIASNYLSRGVEGGLLQPVDRDGMKNRDEILEGFQTTGYEPADAKKDKRNAPYVGIPYALGGVGITWLTDKLGKDQLTGSFADLWTYGARKANKHATVFDESQFTLAMALAKIGKDINTKSQDDLNAAADALLELKPHLSGFSPTTITDQVLSGQGWIQMAYTGDTYVALTQSKKPDTIRWELCKESAIYNNDNCAIPKAAKHPGTATVFMDFLLRPENQRKIVNGIGYIIPTKSGVAAYNKLTADYPFLKTDADLLQDFSQWIGSLDSNGLRMWQQAWTRVKAG